MLRKKKSFIKMAVAALLTLIVLASCSPSKPTPQFTIRFGFWQTQSYLPYFVIQEKGFSKENGLQFVETPYAGGG
jgi:ABC-type nitrate/sulfonate/bicarbonate transport system substrate-binding protein